MSSSDDDPTRDSAPDLQILGDQITLQPRSYVEPATQTQDGDKEEALMQHMARFRSEPLQFLREVSLYVSGTGWRAYDKVIGQPLFYPGFSEQMKAAVVSAPLLQAKIAQLADLRLKVEEQEGWLKSDKAVEVDPVKRAQRRRVLEQGLLDLAGKLTDDMICKFESKTFIRGAYYLVTQLLTRAYHQGTYQERLFRIYGRGSADAGQEFTFPAKKSYGYGKWPRKPKPRNRASYSYRPTDHTSITSRCS